MAYSSTYTLRLTSTVFSKASNILIFLEFNAYLTIAAQTDVKPTMDRYHVYIREELQLTYFTPPQNYFKIFTPALSVKFSEQRNCKVCNWLNFWSYTMRQKPGSPNVLFYTNHCEGSISDNFELSPLLWKHSKNLIGEKVTIIFTTQFILAHHQASFPSLHVE